MSEMSLPAATEFSPWCWPYSYQGLTEDILVDFKNTKLERWIQYGF